MLRSGPLAAGSHSPERSWSLLGRMRATFIRGSAMIQPEQLRVETLRTVAASLAEDVGTGDLTARLIPAEANARGRVVTRELAVICGTAWFDATFEALDPSATVLWHVKDGDLVQPGQALCDLFQARQPVLQDLQFF